MRLWRQKAVTRPVAQADAAAARQPGLQPAAAELEQAKESKTRQINPHPRVVGEPGQDLSARAERRKQIDRGREP